MSDIEYTLIDENYPIAGQDNDSQGFRDNFQSIKVALGVAKSEINTLQSDTAKLNAPNNFNGTIIQNASMLTNNIVAYGVDNVISTIDVNYTNGQYQTIQVGNNLTLRLAGWPASTAVDPRAAIMRVIVYGNDSPTTPSPTAHTITWAGSSGSILKLENGFTNPFSITFSDQAKVFEFWTHDGGSYVFGRYLGEYN